MIVVSPEGITPVPSPRPRIAIYGVGQYGLRVAQIAISKGYSVVAAYNRSGEKVGKDLARIAGFDTDIGVVVQDSEVADFDSLSADVAIVAVSDSLRRNMSAYRRLLGAGVNVICHGTESYFPYGIDAACATEIDKLARHAGVTFTGTGIWDTSRIWSGLLVASPCTEIRSLYHRSITDTERLGVRLAKRSGIGMTQDEFATTINKKAVGKADGLYMTIPHQVLEALGYTVTHISEKREPVLHEQPVRCDVLDRDLLAGECAGMRMVVEAQTREGVTASAHIELRVLLPGETEHMFWSVDGDPSTRITVERDDSVHASAASMFNRIPDVIAAPSGIKIVSTLGPMRHSALIRPPAAPHTWKV